MKIRKVSVLAASSRVETLELRQLLSSSVITPVPTQNLAVGQSAVPVTLGSYFKDALVPAGDTVVEMKTNLPAPDDVIPLLLTDRSTPQTVANFLHYISSGEYANSLIHRDSVGFALQGGGYYADGSLVTQFPAIPSESSTASLKNTTGTIAAVLSSTPNSATSQWFINLANNDGTGTTPNLDNDSDGGPYTAFGKVIYNGLTVVNDIAKLPLVDGSAIKSAWNTLPVQNAAVGDPAISEPASNLISINPVVLPGGLSYTVTSANSAIVTGSVVNGQLVLTPGSQAGSTKVTVVAMDLGGGTATSSFTVKVNGASTGTVTPKLTGSVPVSAVAGIQFTQKEKLTLKAGASGFNGLASGAILLSSSSSAADSVATLASTSTTLKLKANQSRTLSLTSAKNFPSGVAVGTYHVLIQSIDSGGATTIDTGKTITVAAAHFDLTGSVVHVPASAKIGRKTPFSFTIANSSSANVAASGMLPFEIETSPDGKLADATVITRGKKKIILKPGQKTSVAMSVALRSSGKQYLMVVLDPGNAVFPNDADPASNIIVASSSITVSRMKLYSTP